MPIAPDKEIVEALQQSSIGQEANFKQIQKLCMPFFFLINGRKKMGKKKFTMSRTSVNCHHWRIYTVGLSFASNHIGKHGGVDWIGSMGNHKDAFLPLYAHLLGFYALSMCISNGESENGKSLVADVEELGETINSFLRNPLILNLYLLVVKLHEGVVGTSLGHLIHNSGG